MLKLGHIYVPFDKVMDFRSYIINFLLDKSLDANVAELNTVYDFKSIVDWLEKNALKHKLIKHMIKTKLALSDSEKQKYQEITKELNSLIQKQDKDNSEKLQNQITELRKQLDDFYDRIEKKSSINEQPELFEDEIIEVDPEIQNAMNFDDLEAVAEHDPDKEEILNDLVINPNQSKEMIFDQLVTYFMATFMNNYTYDGIYEALVDTGLSKSLDRYDLYNMANDLAKNVKLNSIDWSPYFEEDSLDEIMENILSSQDENHVSYNDDIDQVSLEDISKQFDNKADDLFLIDRILDERLKIFVNIQPIINESYDKITKTFRNLKRKNASILNYKLNDVNVADVDYGGRLKNGSIKYQIKLKSRKTLNNQKDIEVTMQIRSGKVLEPKHFTYNTKQYPLQHYYINKVMDL